MTFNKWLITLASLLVATDIAILLDIPVLRQILGFLCFITIPGLLIVYTLKLHEISFLKKLVLSVGLSLSFLIFVGLLINTLLPWFGYSQPLATTPLALCLSLAIVILGIIAYWRNKGVIQFTFIPKLSADIKNKLLWPMLFPLLFPLLAVIGRNVMDTGGSNVILMALFLLISLYIILLMWQNKKIPQVTYPIAIGMISLTLLLSRTLMSNYLVGDDIYAEYRVFQMASQNLHWSLAAWHSNVNASLSVSLLPAIFQSILKINPVYMYKVVFMLPISLIPIIGYVIYEKYMGRFYGFLASFFFIAQFPFMYLLTGHMRLGMALIPFSLVVMVLSDDQIAGLNKKILFLVFIFSTVVEYYVLPVILLFIMFVLWLVPKISKGSLGSQPISIISAVILPSLLIYFWWGQLTATALTDYIFFSREVFVNLVNIFSEEVREIGVTIVYTLPPFSLPMQVPGMIQRSAFVFVGIGVVSMLMRKEQRVRFSSYVTLSVASLILLVAIIVLPFVSIGYAGTRLYLQVLIVLAPAFIIGCQAISDGINTVWTRLVRLVRFISRNHRPQFTPAGSGLVAIVVGVMLVSQFIAASNLYHTLFGLPGREIFDEKSQAHGIFYVYDSEVQAAEWLGANNVGKLTVYMGNMEYPLGASVFEYTDYARDFDLSSMMPWPPLPNSYVFLRHYNVVVGRLCSPVLKSVPGPEGTLIHPPLEVCAHYFPGRSKIYSSGSSEIYRGFLFEAPP